MNGCIYRTEGGKCKQFSVGGVMSFCYIDGTCDCQIPSNADRIRGMTDEELAELMEDKGDCPPIECPHNGEDAKITRLDCKACWLDWLKSPVEEVQDGT